MAFTCFYPFLFLFDLLSHAYAGILTELTSLTRKSQPVSILGESAKARGDLESDVEGAGAWHFPECHGVFLKSSPMLCAWRGEDLNHT